MPPSITLSNLSWSTPDGRPLFADLNLSFEAERIGLVGRNGVGKTTLLRLIAGDLTPASGAVSVSGVLGVLRQSVRAQADETIADLFGIREALALLDLAERGEAGPEDLDHADWTLEARIGAALGRLRLNDSATTPLSTLSGGQRTRAGLAALVFAQPDVILLDEPTNNLDREGRDAVIDLLSGWRAGALVVSHDRELLERMDAIVELTTLGATRYGGGWSRYRERKAADLAAVRRDLADAERRVSEAAQSAQANAERQARKDGAGARKAAKGDAPKVLLGRRKERSEATGAGNARLAERQGAEAAAQAGAARARIEVLQPLSVTLASTGLPARKAVLEIDRVTAGYDPARPILREVSLSLTGPERAAVTGPNGSGKTTLLAVLAAALAPWAGTVRRVDDMAVLDQQVSLLEPDASIRDNFRRLNPQADENACRAALAKFMFRADAALQTVETLSGGQLLRAGLACVLGGARPPSLLVLDEPTNHLDIEAIEAVEAGLRAYDGALLVVSHDDTFLEAIGVTRRFALPGPAVD